MTIRVVVADDQDIVRAGLTMILNAQPDIEVVAAAADGRAAIELARRVRPDVCLFDIRMPGLDGLAATRALAGPDVADPMAVVVITTFDLDEYVYAALRAGARGFLLKDAGARSAEPGRAGCGRRRGPDRAHHHPTVARRVRRFWAGAAAATADGPADRRRGGGLTAVARGRTNSEVAAELHIALSTVKTHIASLLLKIGVRNRVEIAMWAYETGRVHPRP